MKKIISVFTALTTVLWLSGLLMILPVNAVTFADGDLAREADEFDVYIIKLVGAKKFKRLILNPDVFNMYGHLEWGDIQVVADGTLADYTTSELVRADGDEKVYKLFPDGDVGTKKWVDTLGCFNSQGYDWDSVYIINSFDRDSYTTASTTMCGTAEAGDITLSLASDTPAAATIPRTSNGIDFMKVNVTGSGTISQLTLKRDGAGAVADFSNVYLYTGGTRLTAGRTISSATSKVTFINLDIQAPTTFTVVGDVAGTAGNQNYFTILAASDVTSDATVGGTFPFSGNALALSGTVGGTLTVIASGPATRNATIGSQEAEISQFKVSADGNEGTNLERIQLFNGGNVTNTLVTNLKLKDNTGALVATASNITDAGYATFIFDSPYYIKKGDSEIFRVYASIGGVRPDRTIKLYLELGTDILGKGTTYGFGMTPTISGFDQIDSSTDAGDEAIDITCKGGDLTLNKVGPNATNIGDKTDDTVFLEFTMTAGADITVKRTELIFCKDGEADGTYDDASVSAGADITDIKIVDKDTGTVIVGPKDGTAFDNNGAASTAASGTAGYEACPGTKDGMWEAFTDTFDIAAGETLTLQITADIDVSATDSGITIEAGDSVRFYVYSYASLVGTSGNVSYVKYTGTTDPVDDSAIAPTGDIAGDDMTIEAASMTLSLASTPSGKTDGSTNRTYIKGQSEVDTVGIVFTAGAASDITISNITLTGYYTYDVGGNAGEWASGKKGDNYLKDTVGKVYLYDTTTDALIPGTTGEGFSGSSVYELVEYTGVNWVIPAGEARTMLVKADISSAAPASGSAADSFIAFDVEAAANVSATDQDGNSVTITGMPANGGNATDDSVNPSVNVGIAAYGSITVAAANDTPEKSIMLMGSTDNEVSKIKLSGTFEAWYIEKFSIDLDADADRDNFTGAALKYQTEAQWDSSDWTISNKETWTTDLNHVFSFSGDARPYIPKDDDSYMHVLVDVDGYAGGYGADSGDYTTFAPGIADATQFKAYGAQSGKLLTGANVSEPDQGTFNNQYIFRARPVFAKKAWSGGVNELARFTITAEGYDVTFDGTATTNVGMNNKVDDYITSASLEFDVIASGTDATTQTVTLYDWNNVAISSVAGGLTSADITTENDTNGNNSCNNASYACLTTISFQFEEQSTATVIPEGTTKEFYIEIDNMLDFNNQDEYIQFKLLHDEGLAAAGAVTSAGARAKTTGYNNCSIVWYDGSDDEGTDFDHRLCMPASMNGIGSFPFSFRLHQGTTQ